MVLQKEKKSVIKYSETHSMIDIWTGMFSLITKNKQYWNAKFSWITEAKQET